MLSARQSERKNRRRGEYSFQMAQAVNQFFIQKQPHLSGRMPKKRGFLLWMLTDVVERQIASATSHAGIESARENVT